MGNNPQVERGWFNKPATGANTQRATGELNSRVWCFYDRQMIVNSSIWPMARDVDLVIIGSRMCSFRKQRKLTQGEVAKSMGIEPQNYSRLERGRQNPTYKMLIKFCDAVKISLKKLMP